ncbi:DNA adenine methylase [Glutamicibacter soli]|uniref:DNA adenine methylase n=1 Tax=Glutamicibacter soli TaxID=453836 RepID=UPI003FD02125
MGQELLSDKLDVALNFSIRDVRAAGTEEECVGVRYIGSKARVAETILDLAGDEISGRFVDAFSGTGSVASAAADRGWDVTVNDSLPSAVAMSVGAIVGSQNVPFASLGGYNKTLACLNEAKETPGFIHAQYSPASGIFGDVERRYFTETNAVRLDSMRNQIRKWSNDGMLTWTEQQLLLADLMQAANSVANISGTYGCFLKRWTPSALKAVTVKPRKLPSRNTDFKAVIGDVSELQTTELDTVYYDPPYTKRQYGAYYHLLETIHAGDEPEVSGVTGLRPWQEKASDYCYKTRALDALTSLILGTRARRILLSYSTEGHVAKDRLVNSLSEAGQVTVHEIKTIGRYRPNAQASASGNTVDEYVIEIIPLELNMVGPLENNSAVSA